MWHRALLILALCCVTTELWGQCGNAWCTMYYGRSARSYQSVMQYMPVESTFLTVKPPIQSTPHEVVNRMLELAEISSNDVLYDLGCGDGRIVKAAAERYGCKAVGIEIDKTVANYAIQQLRGVQNTKIIIGDAKTCDLSKATVVMMYLTESLMRELVPKLINAQVIVSYSHPIPGYLNAPHMVDKQYPIYVARPEWRLTHQWHRVEVSE